MSHQDTIATAKEIARAYWAACDSADAMSLDRLCAPNLDWEGPWPVRRAGSAAELVARWARPLSAALPEMRRGFHILTAGLSDAHAPGNRDAAPDRASDGRIWAAGTGYLEGTAVDEVFSIPATDRSLRLRWGEFLCIEDGKITRAQMILDFVDWFEQIGRPVLVPNGTPAVWPAATAYDATALGSGDAGETAASLALGRDLIYGGLNTFDENELRSMGMRRFFHPNLKWYGPGGIGGCLSLAEFEERHQSVWLTAFPDRKVRGLASLFAEDRIVAASGTAGVLATHAGPYLGTAATHARIEVSGLDFWLRTGDVFTENWVFVDMIKLFAQMRVDLFARMRNCNARARTEAFS